MGVFICAAGTWEKSDPGFRKLCLNPELAQTGTFWHLLVGGECGMLWNWMGLSSFKIPSWLKENNIHCLKTPLFVFSPFPILRSRNLQKHSVFASCSTPKTFLETKWSRNLWVVLLQNARTNRGTSLLMFRLSYLSYFCYIQQNCWI